MVDPRTFAINLALIIGALVLLLFGAVAVYALWTGVNVLIWLQRKRRAERKYRTVTYRPDGQPYPPFMEGVCTRCGRGHRRIYFAGSGHELCPACYDAFWREESRRDAASSPADQASGN